jgi:hypothetical protein
MRSGGIGYGKQANDSRQGQRTAESLVARVFGLEFES